MARLPLVMRRVATAEYYAGRSQGIAGPPRDERARLLEGWGRTAWSCGPGALRVAEYVREVA
ncbi:MAG: hypothetical protein ACRDJ4_13075 [Actinomycetota bacterium]